MGAANGTQFRLVDAELELRRETRDFARWTLVDVDEIHRRFKKTFGFAVTASQFESLLLLKSPDSVGIEEVFEVLDANRDGRVDGLELFAALACVCRASFEDKARFTFDLFDFNHNGSLSVAELALLMKSVLIGMTLLTGGGPESSSTSPDASNSMEVMLLCLSLAENAFSQVDKANSVLGFEDFIAWARSNREFMLQVERFRLIAEKAIGFEDALSLPDGSDDDSDLEAENVANSDKNQATNVAVQSTNTQKRVELPAPWMIGRTSQYSGGVSACMENGMPPPANLQLEWVYGTSGPSARNGCRFLATGEAAYFVGSYVVLYNSTRHEQRYYCGHRRPIGCLDVNARGEIVATGDACASSRSGNAEIHVWNARTLHCLAVLRNFHPAGVAHVSFPGAASAATATLRQTQALSLGERSGTGGNSSSVLSSSLMKKKPQGTEALIASVGSDDGASMALWNWQKESVVASGRAHPAATGRARSSGNHKRPLAIALNEDGDEIVVVGAHFVVFHQVGGRFFKHKKPHWHGTVDPPLHTVPACLSAVYYGIQTVIVGTARGELLLFERHTLTRCIQAHDTQTSVNVCLLSCQSMVLFSAGKDGQIKQWDSTLRPIGQSLDLHLHLPVPEVKAPSSMKNLTFRPENVLEGDDFRISSLDYDAQQKRFLVATRAGNIFEISEEIPTHSGTNDILQWKLVASGHTGQPTRSIATASTTGGCFASCGVGERFIKLWSLRRRSFVQNLHFPGATAVPSALEFSSNGERLAVGSEDGSLMLARRIGASNSVMTIENTMKNTSSAVIAIRFGPLQTEPLLAVTRDNGIIYLYKLESKRFSRYMLLKPQAKDVVSKSSQEIIPANALDFSIDGAFLRTQHGNSVLYFWDLRQRAGTRVTSMGILRDVQWYTHTTSIGWNVGGLPTRSDGVCVVGNSTRNLALVLTRDGDIHLTPFPCQPTENSEHCWLSRSVPNAHLVQQTSVFNLPWYQPPLFGDFALRGSVIITSSQLGAAICQWRVVKELGDVQPRPDCHYDQALRKRLQVLGLKDVYFNYGLSIDEEEQNSRKNQRLVPRKTDKDVSHAVIVQEISENCQRSEAPDLALTLSYVYGFNHRSMSVNQSLACLGNGSFVYGVGPMLIVRHLNSLGSRQRVVTSRLQHSVSCIVKHPSEPVLAVGSRRDDRVVLLRTEKASVSGTSSSESFQQVATLKASVFPTNDKKILITVDFCDANDSNYRTVQSDLAAVIWKSALTHVHTLVFYAWKRQLTLAHTEMTRFPVLFGKFTGSSDTGVNFVSGGVDHVTFWHLNPATGHLTAQQGVFGRHALVQTMICATSVPPFVLTGGEDGSVVLWESSVAAHTIQALGSSRQSSKGDGVVELKHLQASQVVLGTLRNGSIAVWKYTSVRSPSRGIKPLGSQIQANTFLQFARVVAVSSTLPVFNLPVGNLPSNEETFVQGMCLLDDAAVAAVILSNGEVLSIDLESILEDSGTVSANSNVDEKARRLLDFSSEINDIALHPREQRWASASTDGNVYVWNLHTNLLLHQQTLSGTPKALAWSATGDHLAVSLLDGTVAILEGTTLEVLSQFHVGDTENSQTESTSFPKWCTMVKYSSTSHNWLALACRDYNIYVYSWDSTDVNTLPPVYTLKHTFEGHTSPIEALDFSLDGEWLQSASSSNARQLLRWNLETISDLNEPSTMEKSEVCGLLDDAWASWTATFAGPVEGLAECCGIGKTTSLFRINSEISDVYDFDNISSNIKNWKSPLPTIIVGLDDGHLMIAWYPLTLGDVATFTNPAVVTKEYTGCFSKGSQIQNVAFSFGNAFVVALARNSTGSAQIVVWKTDYEEELRLRQRFALKSAVSLGNTPNWYTSPVDWSLFEESMRAQRTINAGLEDSQQFEEGENWTEKDSSLKSDQELYLEFVYGLNSGATASRNVFYADDAWEIVYAAGACGVVYNTKTQTQLLNYNTNYHTMISAMAVHPKGDLVASGECIVTTLRQLKDLKVPEIVLWDANSGSTILRIATKHRPGVLLLDFSSDGRKLASIGMEKDHTLAIYVITGGENEGGRLGATLLATCKTSTRRVWSLNFGEDDELVTCGDQHILFWQQSSMNSGRGGDEDTRATGLKSGLLTSHKECNPQATLLQLAHFSGRARIVVSSQADGSLYLWKDRVCTVVRREAHGEAPIPALAVDQKQCLLYSGGADSRICVWNAQLELVRVVADIEQLNDGVIRSLPLTNTKLQSIAVRDGHILFTTAGSEVCELVEVNSSQQKSISGKDLRLHVYVRGNTKGQVTGLAVHPCKRAQFASSGDDGIIRLWDAATRSLLAFHRWDSASELATGANGDDELRALAFSSDGKHLAVGTANGIVRILTAALDAVVTQWSCWQEQPGFGVLSLQYSLNGSFFAVGCQDGSVHIYNAASYRKITVLQGAIQNVNTIQLDFARDRPVLRVQSNSSQEFQFWEIATWKSLTDAQVRDVHWESKRYPSLVNGTTQSENFNGTALAIDGHATQVINWVVTKNEQFLLSAGGADRVVCQFRLPPRSSTRIAL